MTVSIDYYFRQTIIRCNYTVLGSDRLLHSSTGRPSVHMLIVTKSNESDLLSKVYSRL